MARIDPILSTGPVEGIAGPHQSTVATIRRGVELGLFTAAEADMMIDRVRAHLTALPITLPITQSVAVPSSVVDGPPVAVGEQASSALLSGPYRTVR
jgi:hypothetical protein